MTTLAEKIAVMQAAERGEKIECRRTIAHPSSEWNLIDDPTWQWGNYDYRVAPRELKIWVWEWVDEPGNIQIARTKPVKSYANILSEQTITY